MEKIVFCIAALLGLTSCASGSAIGGNEGPVSSFSSIPCAVPAGWAEIAALDPKYVVFGELHGTREAPAFVGSTLCGLAAKGERLLLAVEHSSADNDTLQEIWLLPTAEFSSALPSTGWKGRKDGVASQAMFELVVRAHELSKRGFAIDIVAFNGGRDVAQREKWAHLPSQGPHEAAQAENIFAAGSAKAYDRVLVLVGNYHARKQLLNIGAGEFEPMAMRLSQLGKTISLDMRYAYGSMWNCLMKPDADIEPGQPVPDEAVDCNNHPARGYSDLKQSPFMRLGTFPGDEPGQNYDGFFWLGAINGSPPLVPD